MKKCLKVLCSFSILALMTSCGNTQNSSSKQEISSPEESSSVVESSNVESSSVVEAKELCTLNGSLSFYGYTVNASLTLMDDNTASYTLDYGKDVGTFTWTDVSWALDTASGTTIVSVPNADPDGKVTYDNISLYIVGENYYGFVATNLGELLISTVADVSVTSTLSGGVELYGYTAGATLQLISDGAALYTLDYGASGKIVLPTSWSVDKDTNAVTANIYNVGADGSVAIETVNIITGGTETASLYVTTVPTNLGAVEISSSKKVTDLAGTYDLYGMYSVNVDIDLYENGTAVYAIEYFQAGESAGAISYVTTWEQAADSANITVHTYSYDAEGNATPVDVEVATGGTETAKLYTSTVATNLGIVEISSSKKMADLAGSIDLYGMYSVNVDVDLYENGTAIYAIEYFQAGESVGAISYVTTWEQAADSANITVHTYSYDADGNATPVDVEVTVAEGAYSATVATNLGDCEIKNA